MTTEKQKCPMCGKSLSIKMNFYKSSSQLYSGNNGLMIFCKDCVVQVYDKYFNITKDEVSAAKLTCLKFDFPFDDSSFEGAIKQASNVANKGIHIFRSYVKIINSLGSYNDVSLEFEAMDAMGIKLNQPTNDIDKSIDQRMDDATRAIKLSVEDLEVKTDVIKLLGYDLFEGYSEFDQKFLYNEILPYLDEDMLDDSFKLSQVVQLVNNNNQIRKLDLVINIMSSSTKDLLANQGEIKSMTSIKNQIVTGTDKIAKENSISVKNRGDKKAGKSTLTYMMKNYRELGFEDAETDYYDQLKAFGMKEVADISNKSIMAQLQFDENDYTEIISTQRELIHKLQTRLDDVEEDNRKLHAKGCD